VRQYYVLSKLRKRKSGRAEVLPFMRVEARRGLASCRGSVPVRGICGVAAAQADIREIGLGALSIAGLIGLMLLLFTVGLYKLIVLGPEVLFGLSIVAVIFFLLLSVVLIGYPKLFMRFEKVNPQLAPLDESTSIQTTGKLLEDRFFEPVPSVTEDTTDLLLRKDNRHRS